MSKAFCFHPILASSSDKSGVLWGVTPWGMLSPLWQQQSFSQDLLSTHPLMGGAVLLVLPSEREARSPAISWGPFMIPLAPGALCPCLLLEVALAPMPRRHCTD